MLFRFTGSNSLIVSAVSNPGLSIMLSRNERFSPSPQSLQLINQVIEEMLNHNPPKHLASYLKYETSLPYRLAFDLDYVLEYIPLSHRVLELGASPPILTAALMRSGYSVTGVDINPSLYQNGIQALGLTVKSCNIETEDLPFSDDSFDVVIMNEVFEHLRIDLIHTMQQVLRVLKPNGKLFLSTPNLKSWRGINNFMFKDKAYTCGSSVYGEYKKLKTVGHMGHVREYTPKEVLEFLEAAGFSTIGLIYRGGSISHVPFKKMGKRVFYQVFPKLRPFFSVIASKPCDSFAEKLN